jgi:exosortase
MQKANITSNDINRFMHYTRLTLVDALLLCVLAFAFAAAFFPVWSRLVSTWISSDDYSHGFFVVPVAFYLVWGKKNKLKTISPSCTPWAWMLVIGSIFLYIFSFFANINTLSSYSMIFFIGSAIILLRGWQTFRLLLFPWLFLFFMVPVPSQIYASITVPLQLLVSMISVALASLSGLPVLREGNVIYLPHHTLEVVQACSGLRSLVALLALTSLFAYVKLNLLPTRIVLFLSAIPIAIGVNIIRVLLIIAAYTLWNFDLAHGSGHVLLGTIIFLLALLIVYFIQRILKRWDAIAV